MKLFSLESYLRYSFGMFTEELVRVKVRIYPDIGGCFISFTNDHDASHQIAARIVVGNDIDQLLESPPWRTLQLPQKMPLGVS